MNNRPDWDEYFMYMAKLAASRSTCLSRPVGAVIVRDKQILSTGYNGALPGRDHCTDNGFCWRRAEGQSDHGKYDVCCSSHAEANAISLAARTGISLDNSILYCTLTPCYPCSKLIIMSGIKRVVSEMVYESENKKRDKIWLDILNENGIEMKILYTKKAEVIEYVTNFLLPETSKRKI